MTSTRQHAPERIERPSSVQIERRVPPVPITSAGMLLKQIEASGWHKAIQSRERLILDTIRENAAKGPRLASDTPNTGPGPTQRGVRTNDEEERGVATNSCTSRRRDIGVADLVKLMSSTYGIPAHVVEFVRDEPRSNDSSPPSVPPRTARGEGNSASLDRCLLFQPAVFHELVRHCLELPPGASITFVSDSDLYNNPAAIMPKINVRLSRVPGTADGASFARYSSGAVSAAVTECLRSRGMSPFPTRDLSEDTGVVVRVRTHCL
jgi:hypothetical protein